MATFDRSRYDRLCRRIRAKSPTGDVDAVHDAFVETVRQDCRHLEARAHFRLKDQHRRQRRSSAELESSQLFSLTSNSASPDIIAQRNEESRRVHEAVEDLPMHYRQVVTLKYFQGCSTIEIAESLGLAEKTVYTRLRRAAGKLRALLADLSPQDIRE